MSNLVQGRITERDSLIDELRSQYAAQSVKVKGRKFAFLKEPSSRKTALCMLGTGALAGTVIGGITGGVIGGCCGSPGGPPGIAIGVAIGVPVGAAIGAAIGAGTATYILYPRYKAFLKTESGEQFTNTLSAFISKDGILEHYCCAITTEPVIDGVRTPDGQLYERSAIEEAIRLRGENPKTREKLTVDDLIPDHDASYASSKAFVDLLIEKRQATMEKAPNLIEGYDARIKDIREWHMNIGNNKFVALQKKYSDGKISYDEFQQERENIQKHYNI